MAQTTAEVLQEKSLYPLSFSVIVLTFLQWAHWAFITQTSVAISSWIFWVFTSTLQLLFLWCPLSLISACLGLKQTAFWNFSRTKLLKYLIMVPIFPIYRPITCTRWTNRHATNQRQTLMHFWFLFRVYTAFIKCSDPLTFSGYGIATLCEKKHRLQFALDNP